MDGYNEYQLAAAKFENQEYESALDLLNRSLANEDHYKTRHLLYRVLMALGRDAEAFDHLENGFRANPRNDRVACDYASELQTRGEIDRAREVLLDILARNPSYGPAKTALSAINRGV